MAYNQVSMLNSWSTDANTKAWIDAINTAILALGWTYSTDTGQISTTTRNITDFAIATTTSTTLNSPAQAAFTTSDIGMKVTVNGAGAAGATLTAYITAYISATQVTIGTAASTTVTAATGQILVGAPTLTNSLVGYKIFQSSDSLSSTNRIYIKCKFMSTGTANIPRLDFEVGTGTNGAGVLSGNKTSNAGRIFIAAVNSTETVNRTNVFCGDGGRLQITLNADSSVSSNTSCLSVARLCNAAGTYQDDGVLILCSGQDNNSGALNAQQIIGKAGGAIGVGRYSTTLAAPCMDTTAPTTATSTPDTIGLHPIATWSSLFCKDVMFGYKLEVANLAAIPQTAFGATRKYVSWTGLAVAIGLNGANVCAMYWGAD